MTTQQNIRLHVAPTVTESQDKESVTPPDVIVVSSDGSRHQSSSEKKLANDDNVKSVSTTAMTTASKENAVANRITSSMLVDADDMAPEFSARAAIDQVGSCECLSAHFTALA